MRKSMIAVFGAVVAAALYCPVYAQEPAPQAPSGQPVAAEQAAPGHDDPARAPKGNKELRHEMRQLGVLNESVKAAGSDELPPPPPPGFDYDFMRRAVEMNLSDEDKTALKRMAFEKPDEFRDEIKKRFHAARQKRVEEFRKTSELQKAYRAATTPEERQKALENIKALVKEQFDQKMEMNKRRLAETEANLKDASKRLEEFKRKYEERKAKAAEIMDERVKDLTKDPGLDW